MEEKDKLGDSCPALTTSKAPVDGTSGVEVEVAEAAGVGAVAGIGARQEEGEEEDRYVGDVPLQSLAPDGGWGWMVALGTFIVNTLLFSLAICFGILFSGFLLDNGASSTTTAWIYNLYLVIWNLSMILVNPLCQEFGKRIIGFIGVFLMSLSIILSGFSTSVSFMYFSFSLLGGLSCAMCLGITYAVLPPYFNKKSGQANILLVSGSPFAQMVTAPLVRYLLAVYTFKGAALIHGAILLNGLVAVSLFHPVKWHLRPSSAEKPQPQQEARQAMIRHENIAPPVSTEGPHKAVAPEVSTSIPISRSVQKIRNSLSRSTLSVASAGSDIIGTLTFLSDETEESMLRMKPGDRKSSWRMLLRIVKKIKSDVTVLRQLRCVIISVTVMLTQTTALNFVMMLPFVAQAADYSLQDAALCISLSGIANLVARIVVSPLTDLKKFNVRYAIMLGYSLDAAGIIVAALTSELWHLMASGIIFGLGHGCSLSLFNPIIVHYMELENLKPTIGIIGLVCSVGFPVLGPLIGVIRDATNSYFTSLCVMMTLDLLSVALWCLMPVAQARDARKDRRINTSCNVARP